VFFNHCSASKIVLTLTREHGVPAPAVVRHT